MATGAPARSGRALWREGWLGADRRARFTLGAAVGAGLGQTAAVVVQAVLIASIIDRALLGHATAASLAPQIVGVGIALAARGALGWVVEWAAAAAAASVAAPLRRRLLSHALALGPTWLAGERAGELALTATVGVDAVGVYFGRYLPQLALGALAPVGVLAWIAANDWVSLVVLLALLAAVPPTMIAFGRRATETTARQWRGMASLSSHLLELIRGLPTLRVFDRVAFGRQEIAEATEHLRRGTLRALRVAFLSALALELLAGLGTGLVAMVLGLRLLDGRIGLSIALAVLLVSPEVFLPLRRAAAEFHSSAEGQAAGERIATVLEARPAVPAPSTPTRVPDPRVGVLVIDRIEVEYPGRGRVLGPLSCRLAPGRRIALVGPSGAGKSTALLAVLGLVALRRGRITLGGIDTHEFTPEEWRREVAWVPQRPHLFAGTIEDNLRFARPSATPSELAAAAAAAGLDEVLTRLPRGLDTPVGEGGVGVSAGERHRIALARAVLHGGRIVLLDEVGAHLDPAARDRLHDSIEPWLEGRSVLVAAHRPDVVATLDDVVVLGAAAQGLEVPSR